MINLNLLSALIRTLRHASAIDGPAAPVARTGSVRRVTEDDGGAMMSTALRTSLSTRRPLPLLDVFEPDAEPRQIGLRNDAPVVAPKSAPGPAAVPRLSGTATAEPESIVLDFTAGARVLQAALRGTELKNPAPPTITSASPLVLDARALPQELAHGLQIAVADSGLFYESHLARALGREYPPAALAREPQTSWSASPPLEGIMATVRGAALTDEASALLGRQLDLLDTRSLAWAGDLWPGQRARIEFEEKRPSSDTATSNARQFPAASVWHTRIMLDLPSLGRVHATLDWRGSSLDLEFAAATPEAESRLQGAKALLATSLADADVVLGRFDIAVDPMA